MKGEYLGAFEELVLLAVAAAGDDAYGITVQERVERDAERPVSLGAVYAALDRLEAKKYVASWLGDTGPYRGGRRKRHFSITADGHHALREMRRVRDRMWRSVAPARRNRLRPGFGGQDS
jgi:DNA-binding PadR family transcriptional regulator